jgi:hypothetical protein
MRRVIGPSCAKRRSAYETIESAGIFMRIQQL